MTKCIHYWILDSNNFGRCKREGCGATKQFPIEPYPILHDYERSKIESLGPASGGDTVSVPFGFHIMDIPIS